METREHVHKECFAATPSELFALLITPSAIRKWWSASRVIVLPQAGGTWAATWGNDEDDPDYITVATISEFQPQRRLVLGNYRYHSKAGPHPFEADFTTEFEVSATAEGACLQVTQSGFPAGPEADSYYVACQKGWRDTFAGIREFLKTSARAAQETDIA